MAVVVTESIQTVVLLVGAICITVIAYWQVGGFGGMDETLQPNGRAGQADHAPARPSDPPDLPWYAVFLGYPVIGIWYWCADQTIVQRVLGAKDENHARVGPLFAGFIKILPVFIFVLPGLMCYVLVQQGRLDAAGMKNLAVGEEVVVDGQPVAGGAEACRTAWNGS